MSEWNNYPRKRFRRASFISLTGEWEFAVSDAKEPSAYHKRITVPFPPESELSGVGKSHAVCEYLFYRKRFSLPYGFLPSGGKAVLHFGAVDQICDVYLNEHFLGTHTGGYLPFSFEITALRSPAWS